MLEIKTSPSFVQNLRNNFIAGLWLFIGSRRSLKWVAPTPLQLLFWVVAGCSANTLFSYLVASSAGHFNAQGLIGYLLWPFLALIAGVFLSQRIDLQRVTLVPAILWLVLDVYMALLQTLLQYLGILDLLPQFSYDYLPRLFSALFVWQSMAVVWVFARELQWPWWERILILVATLVTLTVWQTLTRSQPIWKVEDVQPTLSEKALYAQSDLLNDVLTHLRPSNYVDSQWYFLGIAGDGSQNVFRSEVQRIKDLFDTRFRTYGYSVALINNDDTTEALPMATHTSITRTLNRMGALMNRNNDVLFLYMTSHGLQNQFSLYQPPIDIQTIDPKWLRQALDASGIRWRVIVISACYSGSFIPELQSPDTLIITASAADRSSFGCGNEEDYTYFGRAFFDEALRQNHSLKATFEQAAKTVARWESAQGFEQSQPQWVIGENMKLMLPQLERQLFPQSNTTMPQQQPVLLSNNTADKAGKNIVPIPAVQTP